MATKSQIIAEVLRKLLPEVSPMDAILIAAAIVEAIKETK